MPDLPISPHVTIVPRPDGSSYAVPKFQWNADRVQAAADVAEGVYSLTQIADRAGVSTGALSEWRKHPEFVARVQEHQKQFRELVMSYGLARKETRLAHLQERHDKLRTIVAARGEMFAALPDDARVPGAETGLVYEHVTANGSEFLIDNKTIATLGDIEKQAAIEVGEWNEGSSPSVAVQIVVPSSAPPASAAPTVTIGSTR